MCSPWEKRFIHPWICYIQKYCLIKACSSLLPLSNHILPVQECSLRKWLFGEHQVHWEDPSHVCAPRDCCFFTLSPDSWVSPLLFSLALPTHLPCLSGLWFCASVIPTVLRSGPNTEKTWRVWNVIPTQHTGVSFPRPLAAPGFEIPLNVCWFLCSGMCMYTSCWWITDFVCGEIEAQPRANEGKVRLKTRALGKINLNGNLKAKKPTTF